MELLSITNLHQVSSDSASLAISKIRQDVISVSSLPQLLVCHSSLIEPIERIANTSPGNANCPALLTYQSNNIRGQWKRAFTSATLVGGGSIGGIIGTTVFRAKDAPNYRPGILVALVANAFIVLIVAALTLKFRRANRRAESGGKPIEGLAGFRYTY